MRIKSQVGTALVLATVCAVASSEPRFSASLAGLSDNSDGRSLDVDTAFEPSDTWAFGAGVGRTTSRTTSGDLDGTNLRASAEVHSEKLGLRGYYRSWNSNGLDTDAAGARAFVRNGGLTLSVLGETRGVDLDYTLSATDPQRFTEHFSGSGVGGGLAYRWSNWTAYAEGTRYNYGSLSHYVRTQTPTANTGTSGAPVTSTLPTLPGLPTLPAAPGSAASSLIGLPQSVLYTVPTLSGSYVTLNQGVFDRLLTAGVGRDFVRSSLRLDWTGANDAVLDTQIDSFSAGYRYLFSDRLNGGVTLGVSHSRYGSVNFGGVSLGFSL